MEIAYCRNLLLRQATEIMQLGDAGLSRVEPGEILERIIERDKLPGPIGCNQHFIERGRAISTAALIRASLPRVVDENLAHTPRCNGEEVRSTVKL
jgi:hypothetical protein